MSTLFRFGLGRTLVGLARIAFVFREFPVFAGEGMQFESHLGHVFSLFRGLWAAERVQAVYFMGPPAGPIFVGGRFCGRVAPSLDFRQRWCCLLVHGPECR